MKYSMVFVALAAMLISGFQAANAQGQREVPPGYNERNDRRGPGSRGPVFDREGCYRPYCSETDWIYDDSLTSHRSSFPHNLGVTPRAVSILFTPDPSQGKVMPVMWSWVFQNTGNPVSIEMDSRAVYLHIYNGAPLHGFWDAEIGWQKYNEGYWKIISYR